MSGICIQVTTLHTRGSRLVRVFVREGLFYFLLVSAGNLLNVIFMFQSNVNIQAINCAFSALPECIMSHPS